MSNDRPKRKLEPHIHLLAGGVSGFASCVLLQPLDLIKTRLQQDLAQRQSLLRSFSQGAGAAQVLNLKNLTIWSTTRDIVRQDSVWALWRGTWPTVLRNVPGSALYFVMLNEMRIGLRKVGQTFGVVLPTPTNAALGPRTFNESTINLIGGGSARAAAGFILMPMTVIKVRYESNLYSYTSVWQATRDITHKEGIRGLFRGSGATILRDAPYAGLYVLIYEHCKTFLRTAVDGGTLGLSGLAIPPAAINMTAGVIGGAVATLITNPFDVVKTQMQLKPKEFRTMVQSAWKIATEERFAGFFAGVLPRLLRKSFNSAIAWTIYEEVIGFVSLNS
ncbi:mitochondrial carrier domain-containing protein [Fimicolochytrium jonesii]|uniref:mitochondrial carrier domain-containing protein n=1 Tax=Fimicolochytrium jonesii TaxID=1396493 RepID=UPI0022FDFC56|nr:mitochondrial carrier domain-containing protein [Fimicolochytrium jonesii]KAI8821388.1 mitochondrial carrier domain-containing protein [Fimicolochytrium jonesii]